MYKEFKPLFVLEKEEESEVQEEKDTPQESPEKELLVQKEEEISKLKEELQTLQLKIKELENEREQLGGRLKSLEEEREKLIQQVNELSSEVESLRAELESRELAKDVAQKVSQEILKGLEASLDRLRREFLDFLEIVLKEFLLSDEFPISETAEIVIKEAFEELSQLRGSVKIYVSPQDYDRIGGFILELRASLGDRIDITYQEDKNLKKGEVVIDTPRFVVERVHEEQLQEVISRAIRDVFKGS